MWPSVEVEEDGQRVARWGGKWQHYKREGVEQCLGLGRQEVEQDGQSWPGVSAAATAADARGLWKGQV